MIGDAIGPGMPILEQLVANQIETITALASGGTQAAATMTQMLTNFAIPNLIEAAEALAAGQVDEALVKVFNGVVMTGLFPMIGLIGPLGNAVQQPLTNLLGLSKSATMLGVTMGLGAISMGIGTVYSTGNSVQPIIDALKAADPMAALQALVVAPAVFANGMLNGSLEEGIPGLLTDGGIIKAIIGARDLIAGVLGAPAGRSAVTAGAFSLDTGESAANTVAVTLPDAAPVVDAPDVPAATAAPEAIVDDAPAAVEVPEVPAPPAELPSVSEAPSDPVSTADVGGGDLVSAGAGDTSSGGDVGLG
ncbi:MAG: hypothetical protein WBA98_15890 [Gordonia sp. (in: high G+C Gram-positive bacteria)]|uniref:hypothetical protein n=1 Tax=Gordonia sp. (in: high G+C Gram-positive bacteria) TaxID=84139 RepID=UPI003C779BD9